MKVALVAECAVESIRSERNSKVDLSSLPFSVIILDRSLQMLLSIIAYAAMDAQKGSLACQRLGSTTYSKRIDRLRRMQHVV
jgi:hypothetical protein